MDDKVCHLFVQAMICLTKITFWSGKMLGSYAMERALQQRGCCRLYLRLVTGWFYESKR